MAAEEFRARTDDRPPLAHRTDRIAFRNETNTPVVYVDDDPLFFAAPDEESMKQSPLKHDVADIRHQHYSVDADDLIGVFESSYRYETSPMTKTDGNYLRITLSVRASESSERSPTSLMLGTNAMGGGVALFSGKTNPIREEKYAKREAELAARHEENNHGLLS